MFLLLYIRVGKSCHDLHIALVVDSHIFWTERRYQLNFLFLEVNNQNNLCAKFKPLSHCLKYLFLRKRRRGAAAGHKPLDDEIPASSHISLQQLCRSGRWRWHNWAQQDPGQRNLPPFQIFEWFRSCQLPQRLNSISQTHQKKLLLELLALTRFIWSPFWALFSQGAYQTKGLFPVWNFRIGDDTYRLNVSITKKSIPHKEYLYKRKLIF